MARSVSSWGRSNQLWGCLGKNIHGEAICYLMLSVLVRPACRLFRLGHILSLGLMFNRGAGGVYRGWSKGGRIMGDATFSC